MTAVLDWWKPKGSSSSSSSSAAPAKPAPVEEQLDLLSGLTVDEVLEAVDAGELGRDEAIRLERAGKRRVTLLRALEEG